MNGSPHHLRGILRFVLQNIVMELELMGTECTLTKMNLTFLCSWLWLGDLIKSLRVDSESALNMESDESGWSQVPSFLAWQCVLRIPRKEEK